MDWQWDLGPQGLAVLAAMALGGGVVAGLLVGGALRHRLQAGVAAAVACYLVGLVISEGVFGWATEEELQPNIDGLSSDEALLSTFLTSMLVVVSSRVVRRRRTGRGPHSPQPEADLSDTAGRAMPPRRRR